MSKVKICGLSREEDILAVNITKPDYIGFVFADKSRRKVTVAKAIELKKLLDPAIKVVGVFVNESVEWVAELCEVGLIDMVQLHGDEDESYIRKLKEFTTKPVICAILIADTIPEFPKSADYLLFDTASAERGGTGKTFNWEILKDYQGKPYFLAGGLSSQNVAKAIQKLHPFAVDVSSHVESKGVKDSQKINEFVSIVRKNTIGERNENEYEK
ncbi:phosphoribosylanthranilate isomerase [Scatolibacter rhodanostii]|uniref:phosphoribosylanthranilate isomerase n=1 Tax=Scatolibacter rhodanostii TaxID=2014781 RepID=UPI000C08A9CB|nr:phosphoribosylanthranilate isomerase [Scatolibacter rhodanostii]